MKPSKNGFIGSLILLTIFSLITIWSTASDLFLTQLSFAFAGLIIMFLMMRVDLRLYFSLSNILYITTIVLLIFTLIFGKNIRGSIRWIDLGFFNLQTSELAKPLLVIFFAKYLTDHKLTHWVDFLKFCFLALLPIILVLIQPDLGSALVLSALTFVLLALSGNFKKLMLISIVGLSVLIPLESLLLKPYQRARLETFINPYKDPQGAGYNVIQATIAVGSGGVLGKGVKLGTQSHLNFLPERHTDFIFASFAEEFGLIGASMVIFSYLNIMYFCIRSARLHKDQTAALTVIGVFTVFAFQATVNIGMNLGIMPVTGITLPLFSYGGSSLLSFAMLSGLALRQLDLITPLEV